MDKQTGRCRDWTPGDYAFVLENYLRMEHAEIAQAIGRTTGAVKNYCYRHGLEKSKRWTAEELATLRACYAGEVDGAIDLDAIIAQLFPERGKTTICGKAGDLGLTNLHRRKSYTAKKTLSSIAIERIKRDGHPKGFLGLKHSDKTKQAISQRSKDMWNDPASEVNSERMAQRKSDSMHAAYLDGSRKVIAYSRCAGGKRADLDDLFVRSAWEANYARYLNWLVSIGEISSWEYEPDVFDFVAIKRGTRSYIPDFKVHNNDGTVEYHEVKGWMDSKSQTKIARMRKYYPNVTLKVIDADAYKALARDVKGFIPNWE